MKIGLPGGRQGEAQIVSKKSPQYSYIARTSNVNNVRAELAQEPQQLRVVPQEQKVKLVMAVQRKFGPGAAKLDSGD
jgi:hypothetical protein